MRNYRAVLRHREDGNQLFLTVSATDEKMVKKLLRRKLWAAVYQLMWVKLA